VSQKAVRQKTYILHLKALRNAKAFRRFWSAAGGKAGIAMEVQRIIREGKQKKEGGQILSPSMALPRTVVEQCFSAFQLR